MVNQRETELEKTTLAPILIDKRLKATIQMIAAREGRKYFNVLNEIVNADERVQRYLKL